MKKPDSVTANEANENAIDADYLAMASDLERKSEVTIWDAIFPEDSALWGANAPDEPWG
jgi:hypothetical protein